MKDTLVVVLLVSLIASATYSILTTPTVFVDNSGECMYAEYPMKENRVLLEPDCSNTPERYYTRLY